MKNPLVSIAIEKVRSLLLVSDLKGTISVFKSRVNNNQILPFDFERNQPSEPIGASLYFHPFDRVESDQNPHGRRQKRNIRGN